MMVSMFVPEKQDSLNLDSVSVLESGAEGLAILRVRHPSRWYDQG